jgi:hypothetical protein
MLADLKYFLGEVEVPRLAERRIECGGAISPQHHTLGATIAGRDGHIPIPEVLRDQTEALLSAILWGFAILSSDSFRR